MMGLEKPRSGEAQVVRVCAGGAVFLAIARRSCCVFHVLVLLCFGIACVSHFHVFSIFGNCIAEIFFFQQNIDEYSSKWM